MNPTFLWFYTEVSWVNPDDQWCLVSVKPVNVANKWVMSLRYCRACWTMVEDVKELRKCILACLEDVAYVGIICDFLSSQCHYYSWQSAHHSMRSHEEDSHGSEHKQWQLLLIRKWTGRLRRRWPSLCQFWKESNTNCDNLWPQQLLRCLWSQDFFLQRSLDSAVDWGWSSLLNGIRTKNKLRPWRSSHQWLTKLF